MAGSPADVPPVVSAVVVEAALLLELSYLWNGLQLGFLRRCFLDSCKPSWLTASLLAGQCPPSRRAPAVLLGGVHGRPEEWARLGEGRDVMAGGTARGSRSRDRAQAFPAVDGERAQPADRGL